MRAWKLEQRRTLPLCTVLLGRRACRNQKALTPMQEADTETQVPLQLHKHIPATPWSWGGDTEMGETGSRQPLSSRHPYPTTNTGLRQGRGSEQMPWGRGGRHLPNGPVQVGGGPVDTAQNELQEKEGI